MPASTRRLIEQFARPPAPGPVLGQLTSRESDVLRLLAPRLSFCAISVRRGVVGAERTEQMMKFMMLVCVEEAQDVADETAEDTTGEPDSFPWLDDVIARGIRLDGDRLAPTREARTVAMRDGEMLVSDGPFAETKEVICGYDILDCADIDEAVRVAAAHPVAAFGRIEVRPFWRG